MKGRDENYIYNNQERYSDTMLSLKKVMKQYLMTSVIAMFQVTCTTYVA